MRISHLRPRDCACFAQSRAACVHHLDEWPVRGVSPPWGIRDCRPGEAALLPMASSSGQGPSSQLLSTWTLGTECGSSGGNSRAGVWKGWGSLPLWETRSYPSDSGTPKIVLGPPCAPPHCITLALLFWFEHSGKKEVFKVAARTRKKAKRVRQALCWAPLYPKRRQGPRPQPRTLYQDSQAPCPRR